MTRTRIEAPTVSTSPSATGARANATVSAAFTW
jgi:hypothetical protein